MPAGSSRATCLTSLCPTLFWRSVPYSGVQTTADQAAESLITEFSLRVVPTTSPTRRKPSMTVRWTGRCHAYWTVACQQLLRVALRHTLQPRSPCRWLLAGFPFNGVWVKPACLLWFSCYQPLLSKTSLRKVSLHIPKPAPAGYLNQLTRSQPTQVSVYPKTGTRGRKVSFTFPSRRQADTLTSNTEGVPAG